MRISARFATVAIFLSFATLQGQTQQIATITSSYPVSIPATVKLVVSTVGLSVSYPVGLAPSSYISGTQLNTDFQGFLSAYPSLTDPPEAILSSVLQSILTKYSQMTGGSVSGEIAGTETIGGTTIPVATGGGTVSVVIGNYGSGAGALVRHPAKAKDAPAR